MPTDLRTELPQWFLIAGMFGLAAAFWGSAPDLVPVHWGLSGEPDRYGGKFEGLLGIPLIALGLYLLMLVVPRLDPRRDNYARFQGAYAAMRTALISTLALVYGFVLLWIRGVELEVSLVVPLVVGGLFVVIGNLLGKVRPNRFFGLRTPWTLSSRRAWVKTHRVGGWAFVFLGIALATCGFLRSGTAVLVAGLALGASTGAILYAYSYLVWRDDPDARTRDEQPQ